jgi:hypothetical protein
MSQQFQLRQALIDIRNLRNDVPVFNPDNLESKELIEAYNNTLFTLVSRVQSEVGFDTYEKALTFVDKEIEILGEVA